MNASTFNTPSGYAGRSRLILPKTPPDLIIEIDITGPSLNKFPIFAEQGIPEVWRHDGARVAIVTLVGHDYVERAESVFLPKVTSAILTELTDASRQSKHPAWLAKCGRGHDCHLDRMNEADGGPMVIRACIRKRKPIPSLTWAVARAFGSEGEAEPYP